MNRRVLPTLPSPGEGVGSRSCAGVGDRQDKLRRERTRRARSVCLQQPKGRKGTFRGSGLLSSLISKSGTKQQRLRFLKETTSIGSTPDCVVSGQESAL